MRVLKFFTGILLIPFCIAVTQTVISLIRAIQPVSVSMLPPSALALGGGFLLWLLLYFTTPRPVRTYVLAHELTHALWALMMDAKIIRFTISKQSGSVTLSKTNFLITLAPYFFPLYTVLVIAVYYALSVFFEVERYHLCWLALVGLSWGFHFTFTISTLFQCQTDIRECGRFFSYSFIYLMNLLGISLWIVTVSSATLEQIVFFAGRHIEAVFIGIWHGLVLILHKIIQ